ncbi:DJ-1/PfpI family protein [Paenibacillus sp. GD4]|uniref:DJ-1/PfpI family protein n=1 Tax=Paenibacillus sp. GD4 TaxID=3068890 RepID=UPI0027965A77|nr:DJ-1/PfpI family protein [Paenibacillus sp. GD4]MDQ1910768.1 DJ-1/PfpI family protein [Paenibacillus sp. GD4]
MKLLMRIVVFIVIITIFTGAVGFVGYANSQQNFWASVRQEPLPDLTGLAKPKHEASKPTVAVLLGNENTEGMDFTIPYQMFAMTGAYNVYAVASDNQVRTLTGGLEVVPHYSFEELDRLLGRSPDIIAIPYMNMSDAGKYEPIRQWLLKHQSTVLLSICAGADNLAATGLLNGKTSATHWQTMAVLTRKYPEVNWVQNRRYVTNGDQMMSSAGISSGIDAVLYVISKQLGEPKAAQLAKDLKYPSYHFQQNPVVTPFSMDWRFSIYVLNNMFQWNKLKAGVLLYEGVEEMAIASSFDIYSDSGTTRVLSVASSIQPLETKHGLRVIARHTIEAAPSVEKMIVPGKQARTLAAKEAKSWSDRSGAAALQYVHSDAPDRFLFEVQLEDLAKQEDVLTAKHAVKRLEYRAQDIQLSGKPFSMETYGALLLTIGVAVLLAYAVDRRFLRRPRKPAAARLAQ